MLKVLLACGVAVGFIMNMLQMICFDRSAFALHPAGRTTNRLGLWQQQNELKMPKFLDE